MRALRRLGLALAIVTTSIVGLAAAIIAGIVTELLGRVI